MGLKTDQGTVEVKKPPLPLPRPGLSDKRQAKGLRLISVEE
jgi:hypothetical protein